MLRKRLVTVLTFVDGVLFRTKKFEPDYRYTLNFVDAWSVDEVIVLDITRDPKDSRQAFKNVVADFASKCFVPLCVGGGVRTLDDARSYLQLGADKVTVNLGAHLRPSLITEIATVYGTQSVVASVDIAKTERGFEVFSHFGKRSTNKDPISWVRTLVELGAGEILLNSIERDGSLQGYEIDLCRAVSDAVSIPVLICGGAGNWKHFQQGFEEGGADAVCTANIYHFSEISIQSAKNYLAQAGILVRN